MKTKIKDYESYKKRCAEYREKNREAIRRKDRIRCAIYREKNREAIRYRALMHYKINKMFLRPMRKEELIYENSSNLLELFYMGDIMEKIKYNQIQKLSDITGMVPNMLLHLKNDDYKGSPIMFNIIENGYKKLTGEDLL